MKLTKENVYVDLRGKSKEELNLITEITGVENLKNYYYLHFYTPLNNWIRHHVWTDNIENKTEVTIEQLKEILKMTRNQELIEEAKKRGYTHDNFKCLINRKCKGIKDVENWHYAIFDDSLYTNTEGEGGNVVYKDGVWAEMIKPIETFTPIAMICTQEQFNAVKPKLVSCKIEDIYDFSDCNYLTNNYRDEKNVITNVDIWSSDKNNRTVHEEWNEEIFLKACGIKTESTLNEQLEETYTLENIQVDCRELSEEQIKQIADVYASNGFEIGSLNLVDGYFFIRNNFAKYCLVAPKDYTKTTITYDKFMELFGNKEKELLSNKTMADLMGYSVLVDNEEQARKLQEIAFEQGFKRAAREEEIVQLGAESFQFGYGGKKVITYGFSKKHYQDKFITKKAHFNDLFKEETLQEKEQRLLEELAEVRKEIEDNKIKVGDWVYYNNGSTVDKVLNIDSLSQYRYYTQFCLYKESEVKKITNPELIKLLEQEIK